MKHLTTKFLVSAVLSALTVSCGSNAAKTQVNPELIEKQLQEMTLREKVGQLFCVRPEAFDVALEWDTYTKIATYQLQAVNEQMVKVNAEYPAGGIILFAHNIKDEPQLAAFMKDLRAFNGDPLFYVDEEGGRVARIGNIAQTLKKLKEKGFWVAGADMDGEKAYYEADLTGPLVLVVGSEGRGMSRLTKEACDFIVSMPMVGRINSLNASVAGSILMYESMRQRLQKKG